MSTSMGKADKGPLRMTVIVANQCVTRSQAYVQKLKKMVEFVASKYAQMYLAVRPDFEFRGFQVTYHHCYLTSFRQKYLQTRSDKQDITLGFFIGKFDHFTSQNNGQQSYFLIADDIMRILPSDLRNEENWNEETNMKFRKLFRFIVHETLHALGAFHADTGIMSDGFAGFPVDQKLKDIQLLPHIDSKTLTIVCESLSIIKTLAPERNLTFNTAINRVTYQSDQSIAAAFFVKDEKYTELYREYTNLDGCKRYTELVPERWDGLVIVHFCGHIFYYSKEDVLTTKICTRSTVF